MSAPTNNNVGPGEDHGEPVDSSPDLAPNDGTTIRVPLNGSEPSEPGREHAAAGPLPDSFSGYEIVREIHRGGQGVVYHAIQTATKRQVAIKVMKEGPFGGAADRARFEREVQILGQLNHPSIVAIHETGSVAGCDYFVMNYITGEPLDAYMSAGRRSIERTLRVFAEICDAINAAHLRGIIHRDIKPGNIRIDANDRPYILDFGLAKLTTAETAPSAMTLTGQFVGSVPWASPEQVEGTPEKIDMRTDVYSLGVILYQMLVGAFPYDVVGPIREVMDRIASTPPLSPRVLRREINDEVETIVLKCLAKERERRYQTAGELARDIRHYLAGEAIAAKRDSFGYVLRKQIRRYRIPVLLAAAYIVLTTVGFGLGFGTSYSFWREAVSQRDAADAARQATEQQRMIAEGHAEHARAEAAKVAAVSGFLQDMLASVDPSKSLGREVTVRYMLDEVARELESGTLNDQPEVEAEIRRTIGNTYRALGLYAAAEPHLRAARALHIDVLGESHRDSISVTNDLAELLLAQHRLGEAQSLLVPNLARARAVLSADDLVKATAMSDLATLLRRQNHPDDAVPLFEEALACRARVLGDDHPDTLVTRGMLRNTLLEAGRAVEARALLARMFDEKPGQTEQERTNALTTLNKLARMYLTVGRHADAEPLLRAVHDQRVQLLGVDHPDTLSAQHQLGVLCFNAGQREEAEELLTDVLRRQRRVLGAAHPDTLTTINDLGLLYSKQARYEEAEAFLREAFEGRRATLGLQHPLTRASLMKLGLVYRAQGRFEEAQRLTEDAAALEDAEADTPRFTPLDTPEEP